jgi:Phycobilisome Linker polypeptide
MPCQTPGFTSLTLVSSRHAFAGASTAVSSVRAVPVAAPARASVSMAFSSIQGVLTAPPTSLPNDMETVLAATYRQMLSNAHLMESERESLAIAESTFKFDCDVREFVRAIANSDAYKSRFFHAVSQYRFIELAFKHMLGRGARSAAEYAEAMSAYTTGGYEACINWFVDSAEYFETFGAETVPYQPFRGCYPTNEEFNRAVAMAGTPSSSGKARSTVLQYCVLSGDSPNWLTISKSLPAGTEKGTGFCIGGHWTSTQRNKNAPVRVGTKIPGGVVFYNQ